MRWTQAQLEAETGERVEALSWLLAAERLAAMPARLAARAQLSDAVQTMIDIALYPQDPRGE